MEQGRKSLCVCLVVTYVNKEQVGMKEPVLLQKQEYGYCF